jgi:hypothetical protein
MLQVGQGRPQCGKKKQPIDTLRLRRLLLSLPRPATSVISPEMIKPGIVVV